MLQHAGVLQQLDCALSRDPDNPRYVQDIVAARAEQVNQFIGHGGHVYVCGRYQGMGLAVDVSLRIALGNAAYQQMLAQGRYHRDLY